MTQELSLCDVIVCRLSSGSEAETITGDEIWDIPVMKSKKTGAKLG
jgi:hypothetical protein